MVSTVISRSALRTRFAGGAADHHLPASFLADQADILDRRLGAVARAADDAHLELVRREQILQTPFQFDAGAGGILHAEAAELGAHAGLHHAHALGVGLAGRHAEIRPDLRQIGLLDAEQIDALAAGDLHHRHVVLVRDVGDAAQFVGRGHAAAHARDHGKRAVLLNVGVDAVVDEARRAVLFVIAAPQHVEHVAQRRLADFAALAVAVDVEHFLHRLQLLRAHDVAQLLLRERHAGAEYFLRLFLEIRRDRSQQLLAQAGATSAAGGGARALLQLRQRGDAVLVNRLDDVALA